jgi:hypothetical protein
LLIWMSLASALASPASTANMGKHDRGAVNRIDKSGKSLVGLTIPDRVPVENRFESKALPQGSLR